MVRIYITDSSVLPDPKEETGIMKTLPDSRKQKILRFRRVEDRKQSLGAGLLLNYVLESYGKAWSDITYGIHGKPKLEGLEFNLSHSGTIVACAVGQQAVGCDLEEIKDLKEKLAERYFTQQEVAYMKSFQGEERVKAFYRLWTLKESYLKMTGEGISLGLDQVEFLLDDEVKVYRKGEHCNCQIRNFHFNGYYLCVCAKEEEISDNIQYISFD